MKEIKLTQGKVALVDDEDFKNLNQFKWYAHKGAHTFYAARRERYKLILMHRILLQIDDRGIDVDHKDRDGLNNQRNNIRLATRIQNSANSRKQKNCTSEFKGVSWNKRAKKWMSSICPNRKQLHLGYFLTEDEAAMAYNKAAIEVHGEFAYLNIVTKTG